MARVFFVAMLMACLTAGSLSLTISDRGDCSEILADSVGYVPVSGRYNLFVGDGKRPVWIYCDMTTDGGGWTVIQRRTSDSTDFFKGWADYQKGFGAANGDYWLGLTHLHSMLVNKRYVLRIELEDWSGKKIYAEYDNFRVGGAGCNYTLESVGNYCGNCGDALSYHLGMPFSTSDRDNDKNTQMNCADRYKSGWWYKGCLNSNLNGLYKPTGGPDNTYDDGIIWYQCKGYYYSYKKSVMMIRPFTF